MKNLDKKKPTEENSNDKTDKTDETTETNEIYKDIKFEFPAQDTLDNP